MHGYLGARVDLSAKISFCPLLDPASERSIQIVSNREHASDQSSSAFITLRKQSQHSPVVVTGIVKAKRQSAKGPSSENTALAGPSRHKDIEVDLHALNALNSFPTSITFSPDSGLQAEQRHLQIRQSSELRNALRFRSQVATTCREFLTSHNGFVEIETPLLFKSTPEGAREFLVPTRRRGQAYALPQSPQQYKQILMASGIPRYFQIAKCFRDEDLRADRQPEFSQLDLEMAFADGKDVMDCIEALIRKLWSSSLDHDLPAGRFPVMTYHDAMASYGSDKPDRRLGMEIRRIGHMIPVDLTTKIGPLADPIVEAFKLSVSDDVAKTRKFVGQFMDSPEAAPFVANPEGQPGIFVFDPRKPLSGLQPFGFEAAEVLEEEMELEEGDLVVLQARKNVPSSGGSTALGRLRLALHKAAVAGGYCEKPTGWNFLWITNFPLFSPTNTENPGQGGSAGLSSTHHPFTAPASLEDLDLLTTEPLEARAEHYDLVLNGVELGGGSRRIHGARLQEFILRDVLKVGPERMKDFDHLLKVLSAGCPPHAGIALGFDRLIAVMLGKESIRDVIAFPKTGNGDDPLVKSPATITDEQLKTYHLRLDEDLHTGARLC